MKKVMILAVTAALLGIGAPSFSQVPGSSQPSSSSSTDDNQDIGTSGSQSGSQSGMGTGSSGSMSQYNQEVKISELPSEITDAIDMKLPGYKTDKAFKASDGTYKVAVSKGDEKQTLYFDENGKSLSKIHSGLQSGSGSGSSSSYSTGSQSGSGTGSSTSGSGTYETGSLSGSSSSGMGSGSYQDRQGTGTSGSSTGTSGSSTSKQSGSSTSGSGTGSSSSMSSGSGKMASYNKEVKTSDLPSAVTRSINEKYPGYKADKAYKGEDGTYKVIVSKGDQKQTLFFDERGESVKMQK